MNFNSKTPLDIFLNALFERYRDAVPAVNVITEALLERGIGQYLVQAGLL